MGGKFREVFILYIHWRESSQCLSPARWQMSAQCNLCLCVHVCVQEPPPKRFKLSAVPASPIVDCRIRPRRVFLRAKTNVVSLRRRRCQQHNPIKWRNGSKHSERRRRQGRGGATRLLIPLGEGRGNFSSRSRRRRRGDTEILRRRAACERGREARLNLSEKHRQRDGRQQLSCPEIKSFFFFLFLLFYFIYNSFHLQPRD